MDDGLDVDLVVVVAEGDEGQDEGVLHLDLVEEDVLAPGLDVGVEQQRPRDRAEQEHVQEHEQQEEYLEPLRYLERQQLVVREGVVAPRHVHYEYHVPQR